MTWNMGGYLRSPNRGYELVTLDGDAGKIDAAGKHYSQIGDQMEWTAKELDALHDDRKYKSEGLDAIRDSAGQLAGDLHKVAKRYVKTGPVLVTYAAALDHARSVSVNPLVSQIRDAHQRNAAAQQDRDDAQQRRDRLDDSSTDSSPTPTTQLASADRDVDAADTHAASTAQELAELWQSFESGYSEWDSAYEAAVAGVQDACDTSGINDTWWEDLLDGIATVATIIGTIAVIVAIIATGPFAAVALLVATIVSVVALAAHLTMLAAGSRRVSLTDILFDAIGVVPFLGAFGKSLKAGEGALGALRSASGLGGATRDTLLAGRGAVAADLRTIAGAGGLRGGRAAREAVAPGLASDFLSRVNGSWGRSAWLALRNGGSQMDGRALLMAERMGSQWPRAGGAMRAASSNWARGVEGAGVFTQGVNLWNFGYGAYQSAGAALPLPKMPDFVPNPFRG